MKVGKNLREKIQKIEFFLEMGWVRGLDFRVNFGRIFGENFGSL